MNIVESIDHLVGHTPLMRLHQIEKSHKLNATLLAKLEYANPAGSVKDRVALSLLNAAEQSGALRPGGTLIEPTSGNTGVGLTALAAPRGYRVIIVMPDSMSIERQRLMRAYGAELVLTEGRLGMKGAIAKAEQLAKETPGSFLPMQFQNPANPAAHYQGTGPEIWQDTGGQVDFFLAGVGTGGTITGAGRFLLEKNPKLQIIAVEPASSPMLSQGKAGPHQIQGIGAGFIPDVLDTHLFHQVVTVENEAALSTGRLLAQREGILAGISSGAVLSAAIQLASQAENAGKTLVALFPDTGERYLSTPLFDNPLPNT